MQDGFDRGSVGFVAHVDSEAVIVIELWMLVDEELGDQLAECGNIGAEERTDTRSEPVGAEELVDAEN